MPFLRFTLLLALIYAASGRLGLLLAIPPGFATAVFPAAGIALGCVLHFGPRAIPGIWLGSLMMNLSVEWQSARTISGAGTVFCIALASGASLQALGSRALLQRRVALPLALDDEQALWKFALYGAGMGTLIGASIGIASINLRTPTSLVEAAYGWLTWWVGDSIGVLLLTPLTLMVLRPAGDPARRQLRAIAIPVTLTFAMVVWLFFRTSAWENDQIRVAFERRADTVVTRLTERLQLHANHLQHLERFFASSHSVSADEFSRFTSFTLGQLQDGAAVSWVKAVPASEREAFVRKYFPEAPAAIWERDSNGQPQPAAARALHYVVTYIEPARSQFIRGFDNASEPLRRRAVEQALRRASLTVSEPLMLLQPLKQDLSVLLVQRVLYPPDHSNGGDEVVIATLQLPNFLAQSLKGIDQTGIAIALSDHSNPNQILPLVDNGTGGHAIASLSSSTAFPFGGRNWQIRIQANTAFLAGERGWQAWFVLAAGALLTGLLGALLILNHSRALRVQRLVDERTRSVVREQQTLQIITDGALDAMLLLDPAGTIRTGNPAAQRLLQQPLDVLRGQALQRWLPVLDSALLAQVSAAGGAGLRQEARLLLPDGNARDVELALTAVQLAEQLQFCCLIHDLTARLAVDKLKREFVAMVSHELRTPLTSIRGALALLRNMTEGSLQEQQTQLLVIADDNSKRLLALVNDLLDFERLQLGKLNLNLQDTDLQPLLERSIAELQPYARQQQIELVCDSHLADPCRVRVDPDRLVQVLFNLLSNAIKFSLPRTRVELIARVQQHQVRLDVVDHGVGIPAELQSNIFQKFWQADATSSRKHRGTGLGLAISQGLVQQMQGNLSFRSTEGVGSTFTIELPLVIARISSSTPPTLPS